MPTVPARRLRPRALAFFRCRPGLEAEVDPVWGSVRAVAVLWPLQTSECRSALYASEARLGSGLRCGYGSEPASPPIRLWPERSSPQPATEAARAYLRRQ